MRISQQKKYPLWQTLVVAGLALSAVRVYADPPADDNASSSLLQQLSDETQRVYRQARHSIVRVALPTPQWLEQYNERQSFLSKWGPKLDPAVREKLFEEQERAIDNLRHRASLPATSPSLAGMMEPHRLVAPPLGTQPGDPDTHDSRLTLFAAGILVDGDGHAMFPVFVDRKCVGDSVLSAITGDGQVTTAKFVGSDAKTNITVLQLLKPFGVPAVLGHNHPDDGSLTLMIAPDSEARLVVWTNMRPEPGFAVMPDGSVAGFGFNGHFLGAATAKPIVDQLIATGEVHRAMLGVLTVEVSKYDPIRQIRPELGVSPAIRILAVQDGSAAAAGGVQPDDLVLAIGSEVVGDAPTFAAVIAARSGSTVLHVLRGSAMIDLTVNLQPK